MRIYAGAASHPTNPLNEESSDYSNLTSQPLAHLVRLSRFAKRGFGVVHSHHAVRFRSKGMRPCQLCQAEYIIQTKQLVMRNEADDFTVPKVCIPSTPGDRPDRRPFRRTSPQGSERCPSGARNTVALSVATRAPISPILSLVCHAANFRSGKMLSAIGPSTFGIPWPVECAATPPGSFSPFCFSFQPFSQSSSDGTVTSACLAYA